MKKLVSIVLVLALVFALTGCNGEDVKMQINADGSSLVSVTYMYEENLYNSLCSSEQASAINASAIKSGDFAEGKKTIGKYTYYTFSRDFAFATCEELQSFLSDVNAYRAAMKKDSNNPNLYDTDIDEALMSEATVTPTFFRGVFAGDEDERLTKEDDTLLSDAVYHENMQELGVRIDFAITFPTAPTYSNGVISGNTVAWELKDINDTHTLIAEAGGNVIASDTEPPVIKGVKNGKLYGRKGVSSMIKVSDNICVDKVTVNGKKFGSIIGPISSSGKYTIVATDLTGNTATVTFTVDATAPVIKGVRYGKTYKKPVTVKFKDSSGIKKIKVNGKKIKKCKSKKFRKKGKYTISVTDNAGNVSKMKFTIKKK